MQNLERVAGWCEAMAELSNDLSPLSRRTERQSRVDSFRNAALRQRACWSPVSDGNIFRNLSGTAGC